MNSYIFNDYFAKLIAQENIKIVYDRSISKPEFIFGSRTLRMPIFSTAINDYSVKCIMEQQIAKALYSTLDLNDISLGRKISKKNPALGLEILKIVEQFRCDKIIRRKYPGTRHHYIWGMRHLDENYDWFGVKKSPLTSKDQYIDRLNYNLSREFDLIVSKTPFSKKERDFKNELVLVETEEDSIKKSIELYKRFYEGKTQDDACYGEIEETPITSTTAPPTTPNEEPIVFKTTANNFDLLVDKGSKKIAHTKRIKDLENYIFSIDETYTEIFDKSSNFLSFTKEEINTIVRKTTEDSTLLVNSMVKEFELRKAAKEYSRVRVSRTGILDMNKIHSYKFNDQIFKSSTTVLKGKNHGMIMFVDFSGSMQDVMCSTILQVINLVSFCKKANIPFDVYGFTTAGYHSSEHTKEVLNRKLKTDIEDRYVFDTSSSNLIHLISSDLSTQKYKEVFDRLCFLAWYYENSGKRLEKFISMGVNKNFDITHGTIFNLGGTPLNFALYLAPEIARKFQAKHNCEILKTIVLTDGDATDSGCSRKNSTYGTETISMYDTLIVDDETNISKNMDYWSRGDGTKFFIDLLKAKVKTDVTLYYTIDSRQGKSRLECLYNMYGKELPKDNVERYSLLDVAASNLKKNKFLEIPSNGFYDTVYILPSMRLEEKINQENSLVTVSSTGSKLTDGRLKTNFLKYLNSKKISKIFLNRFISMISKEL